MSTTLDSTEDASNGWILGAAASFMVAIMALFATLEGGATALIALAVFVVFLGLTVLSVTRSIIVGLRSFDA